MQVDVVELLGRLVAYPTVSNRPLLAAAADIAERCTDLGFRVERFIDPNDAGKCSILATAGPPGTDGLVLSGHMDVVPTEGQPWTSDPFQLTRKGDRLVGRGSADMKGFIAATLVALERIDVRDLKKELVLLWTHDEEVGCKGSAAFVEAWQEVERPLPRATLIGEPTSFQVLRMHPGHVAVEVVLEGKAAHSSRPDLGINAIERASTAIGAIQRVARRLLDEPADLPELERPVVAVNVAEIQGGSAINIVPDRCVVRLGYRPLPGQASEEVFERIESALHAERIGAEARILRATPAMLTPKGTPLEQTLCTHAHHPHVGAATFATDGGNLARLGLQPLIFGPGDINVAHKADEFVPVGELVQAVDIVEQVIRRHCC